jgi:hypothetical protein
VAIIVLLVFGAPTTVGLVLSRRAGFVAGALVLPALFQWNRHKQRKRLDTAKPGSTPPTTG